MSGSTVFIQHKQEYDAWEPKQDESTSNCPDEVENGSYILDKECTHYNYQMCCQTWVPVCHLIDVKCFNCWQELINVRYKWDRDRRDWLIKNVIFPLRSNFLHLNSFILIRTFWFFVFIVFIYGITPLAMFYIWLLFRYHGVCLIFWFTIFSFISLFGCFFLFC